MEWSLTYSVLAPARLRAAESTLKTITASILLAPFYLQLS